jgi:hypothetical protein
LCDRRSGSVAQHPLKAVAVLGRERVAGV